MNIESMTPRNMHLKILKNLINILHSKQQCTLFLYKNMNDEAVNAICNTLLSIKSDISELKQNYKMLKIEHTELKECFENFKTQIQTLSEIIRSQINELKETNHEDRHKNKPKQVLDSKQDIVIEMKNESNITRIPSALFHFIKSSNKIKYRQFILTVHDIETQNDLGIEVLYIFMNPVDCPTRDAILRFYPQTTINTPEIFNPHIKITFLTNDSVLTSYDLVLKYAHCENISLSENDSSRKELDMGRVYFLIVNGKKIEFRNVMCYGKTDASTPNEWIIDKRATDEAWRRCL